MVQSDPIRTTYPRSQAAPSAGDTSVANGGFFQHPDGSNFNGACITNLATAGDNGPDGKPDGFANPIRKYQEFVVEYARNLKNNWQMRANFRYARLFGNYEGFFRNDNGQSDPGISSLFDFTTGALGLLGDQFAPGLLNTDRRMVFNMDASYLINVGHSGDSRGEGPDCWRQCARPERRTAERFRQPPDLREYRRSADRWTRNQGHIALHA